MRVASIGGGPGGLFLAALLRRRRPDAEVQVLERNPPDATFGFGVVFSERTLDYLEAVDPVTYTAIDEASVDWEDIEVRHRGRVLRCGGHGFSAVARKRLLAILQERAADAGAEISFGTEADEIPAGDHDVVLGADGLNSLVRERLSERFRPSIHTGAAKYIWFATPKRFDALTFIFEESEHGHFAVHAYPFDEETSTFIVETDEGAWRRAGLDRGGGDALPPGESDLASMEYCRELFAAHLDGEPLLANNSKWLNFRTVRNESWRADNVVLIGDAAHTAHFSVGSGTKMAMEDAIELAAALAEASPGATGEALARYERERRPAVERIQAASHPSRIWWETFRHAAGRAPEQFAFHFLTRTPGFVTRERLRARDPRFVRRAEQWFEEAAGGSDGGGGAGGGPGSAAGGLLLAPLELGEVTLPNRLAARPALPHRSRTGEPSECDLVHLAAPALCGAGLVLVEAGGGAAGLTRAGKRDADPADTGSADVGRADALPRASAVLARSWERVVELVHGHSAAAVGLRLRLAHDDEPEEAAEAAAEAGFDLLVVGGGDQAEDLADLVQRVRRSWPARRPLGAELTVADGRPEVEPAVAELVEAARLLERAGCALVSVALDRSRSSAGGSPPDPGAGPKPPGASAADEEHRHLIQLLASDRIRALTGLRTVLAGGPRTRDEAVTAVLAGRADLCEGSPDLASDRWTAPPPPAAARCSLDAGVGIGA